ncbi:MAG: DUF952 domain-containing protein [Gammaproteobacteria bacterium]|jgi:uncharacterized protein (DUF952 family)
MKVYKILTVEEWQTAQQIGEVITKLDKQDGFIHLSTAKQLAGTLSFYFDGFDKLILLEIESTGLGDSLLLEESKPKGNRTSKFPHLYGRLELNCITKIWEIQRNGFLIPKEILLNLENTKN